MTDKPSNIAPAPTENTLSHYLRQIRHYPLLQAEDEMRLARRWRDHGDEAAAHKLAQSYLRLVVKIARGFLGYKLRFEDLISEGNVGLMQAIERFDPERGFRLSTYAPWWIRAAIQDYVLRSASLVRLGTTAGQKKLFFNLRRIKAAHGELEDRDLDPETVTSIATALGVSEDEVIQVNRRLIGGVHSLNASRDDGSDNAYIDSLVDETPNQEVLYAETEERRQRRGRLDDALATLTERERHIITQRRLQDDPPTLESLSHRFGVSRERVRQIEVRAVEKLRAAMVGGRERTAQPVPA
jgi:RNA polymerase sigma-32 factor